MQMEEFTMNKGLQLGAGGKSSHGNSFSLTSKVAKILYKGTKILRHYGTRVLDVLSALVPDALATFGKITQKTMAFTLAETLIVMGVIGIVSALTLPNLNSSTGDKERVAKVKKIYQNLNDAIGRAEAVYGPSDEWIINDTTYAAQVTRFGERVTEFMKTQKNCGYVQTDGACWTVGDSKKINGTSFGNISTGFGGHNTYRFITADGTPIAIWLENVDGCSFVIYADIDGANKGQNIHGKDVFHFQMDSRFDGKYRLEPVGSYYVGNDTYFKNRCWNDDGGGCTAWVVLNDNVDYLKLDSQGKCPNGTVLSWSNTTCK